MADRRQEQVPSERPPGADLEGVHAQLALFFLEARLDVIALEGHVQHHLLSGRVPRLIPIQYLNAHTLTVANTGAGKTIRGKFYALQIAPQVRGLWLLDLRKQEFRVLRPYLARVGVDLVVFDARDLRINPLQVPLGVAPADWTSRVSNMMIQSPGSAAAGQ